MLHHSHQSLRDKLAAKFDAKKKTQNQPVTIKDIYVYPEKFGYSHGEFCDRNHNHTNLYRAYPVLLRLNDHIESLAMIANIYHEQYYCDKDSEGKFQIKT